MEKNNLNINERVGDVLNMGLPKDTIDGHWDSYEDSRYHDTYNDRYEDRADSVYHDEYQDGVLNETIINGRVRDVLNTRTSQDVVDGHWDSYEDSRYHDTYNDRYEDRADSVYHDEYQDAFLGDKQLSKKKTN